MEARSLPSLGAGLTVLARVGAFRCALEASAVERLEPRSKLHADPGRPVRRLSEVLRLGGTDASEVAIVLRDRPEILLVEAIEAVRDLGGARFLGLPALTRLERPVLRGVWQLEGDELLPALDLDHLFEATETADG